MENLKAYAEFLGFGNDKNSHLKYEVDEKTGIEKLVGKDVAMEKLGDYYIIELKPIYENGRYLCFCSVHCDGMTSDLIAYYSWHLLSGDLRIASGSFNYTSDEPCFCEVTSPYGDVVSVIELKDLAIKYKGLKSYYSPEEIQEIFESFKSEYPTFDFSRSRKYYAKWIEETYPESKNLIKKI